LDKDDNSPWAWRYEAKCKGEDTEIFFPPRDKNLYKPIADKAKSICYGRDGRPPCPVRKECLKEAILIDEMHGIFGGMSHRERNALKRKYTKRGLTLDQWLEQDKGF
jgi:WhiB family redox-sensing transcriptional regulator